MLLTTTNLVLHIIRSGTVRYGLSILDIAASFNSNVARISARSLRVSVPTGRSPTVRPGPIFSAIWIYLLAKRFHLSKSAVAELLAVWHHGIEYSSCRFLLWLNRGEGSVLRAFPLPRFQ